VVKMNNKDTNLYPSKFQDARYRTRIANFGANKKSNNDARK